MHYLYVGAGGLLGACARYFIFTLLRNKGLGAATFAVNIIGCALLGLIIGFLDWKYKAPHALRLFLVAGFVGSFTTFATFVADAGILLERNEVLRSLGYTVASVFCGGLSYFAVVYTVRFFLPR